MGEGGRRSERERDRESERERYRKIIIFIIYAGNSKKVSSHMSTNLMSIIRIFTLSSFFKNISKRERERLNNAASEAQSYNSATRRVSGNLPISFYM
jgi:hypothetical protein